jgi:hypothetical protein
MSAVTLLLNVYNTMAQRLQRTVKILLTYAYNFSGKYTAQFMIIIYGISYITSKCIVTHGARNNKSGRSWNSKAIGTPFRNRRYEPLTNLLHSHKVQGTEKYLPLYGKIAQNKIHRSCRNQSKNTVSGCPYMKQGDVPEKKNENAFNVVLKF